MGCVDRSAGALGAHGGVRFYAGSVGFGPDSATGTEGDSERFWTWKLAADTRSLSPCRMSRRVAVAGFLGVVLVFTIVVSRLVPSCGLPHPKTPGLPIFAGHWSSGGRLLHTFRPEYPLRLRQHGFQRVVVSGIVREDGSVGGVTFDSGAEQLFPYAKSAVEKWRYEPLRVFDPFTGRSRAVSFGTSMEVSFDSR